MFRDREDAGNKLALKLRKTIKDNNFVVVALLRGGIVLGKKISDYFKVPLFPLAIKKIGAPLDSELAIGAVTFDETSYFDKDLIQHLNVDINYIKNSLGIKSKEAEELQRLFKSKISLENKKVIVVDDGVATGATVICAVKYVKKLQAKEIILATPIIAKDSLKIIKNHFDRVVSLEVVQKFHAIGEFYADFRQLSDEELSVYCSVAN